MRRVFPPKKVGYAFKLKADFAVAEIYGEKQQAGMEVTIAVRGRELEQAKTQALQTTRALAPSVPIHILGMKDAYETDFDGDDEIHIIDKQMFGQSKHGRF